MDCPARLFVLPMLLDFLGGRKVKEGNCVKPCFRQLVSVLTLLLYQEGMHSSCQPATLSIFHGRHKPHYLSTVLDRP